VTALIDGLAASIASMIAMAGDEVVMPANAMLMLHDPSGLVMGTAGDMRAMAEALDKMKAGMVGAYRTKSGRDHAEIEALMQAETWLTAEEAVVPGLADRVDEPVRMAARFDLSRFQHPPPQLAAAIINKQETDMPDPKTTRAGKTVPAAKAEDTTEEAAPAAPEETSAAEPPLPAAEPPAEVIDLDDIRAAERQATLAYVSEVHELCALAGRGEQAAGFIAKATPVDQVRRALLEARAAEDEATAIRGQVRSPVVEPQPAIDTQAIYAARNQNVR
jgi:hypothetical protein